MKFLPNHNLSIKVTSYSFQLFMVFTYILTSCSQNPFALISEPTITPSPEPTATLQPTAVIHYDPLIMDFGLKYKDFSTKIGFDIEYEMKKIANEYGKEYPYQYLVFNDSLIMGRCVFKRVFNSNRDTRFLDKCGNTLGDIAEPDLVNKVFESQLFSEKSVDSTHQTAIYVTEEEDEKGIRRNGFFSYTDHGIAIFINEYGSVFIYRGNSININDPKVRSLFQAGYTQVRIINGKPRGFFNIKYYPRNALQMDDEE